MKSAAQQHNTQPAPFTSDRELRWIQITASLVSVIGLVALFALMIQNAQAADNGFNPGNRPAFPSPFGNQGGNNPPPFFEEEEDTDFGNPGEQPSNFPPPGGAVSGDNNGGSQRGAPSGSGKGVSFGGNATSSGVISKKNIANIQLDAETGEGGRELVSDFNFPDADIMDIAKTLGRLTGKNFIFDKDVKGRISIISNSPITVGDAWKAFLTALDMNGFALIPSGKYIRIARQRDARDKQLKTYTGDYSPDTDALITRVFPLKYIDAEEVARTFRSFMPANSRIIPYEQTNTVIVTDTGSNIAKLNKMLDILDVEGYDAGIEVIPVKFASAAELSKLIDTLIPGTGGSPVGAPGAPRFGGGGGMGRGFSARRTKEGGIINTIIADERTNTLIVHANSKGAGQVRALVNKLDQKQPAQVGGGKVHVYYLQFADAEQIANTLNSLSQGTGRTASPVIGGGTGVNPTSQNIFEGSVKVSPDKSTNSLVVNASPADYGTVRRVIERLDIPRDQVYVEVIVMEIALTKEFQFSANVASPVSGLFSTPNADLLQSVTNPGSLTGAVLGFKSGGSQDVTINNTKYTVSNVQGLIRAIQTESKSNVLATPQIIALDNTEATFDQTEKIPVPSSTAIQGSVSSSFTKEPVPLSIKIKPQINKMSNFVKLDVEAKIASIQNTSVPSALQSQTFGTLERSAKSSVFIGDSDTMVLGGLIRDQTSISVNKIPLLGDIPILGWLFSSRVNTVQKTNLLIFLTPRIVRQYEKIRAILDRKLKERDDFIEKQFGGQDPSRAGRDEIIRGLPDLTELSKKPQASVSIDEDEAQPTNPSEGAKPVTPAAPQNSAPSGSGNTNGGGTAPGLPVLPAT
ncbi:MAG: type II secretion system secretin GspD [Bdellovibrionia bacterium]